MKRPPLAVIVLLAGLVGLPACASQPDRDTQVVLTELSALRGREACVDSVSRLVRAARAVADDSASVGIEDVTPKAGTDLGDTVRSFVLVSDGKPYACLAEYQDDREWHVVKLD